MNLIINKFNRIAVVLLASITLIACDYYNHGTGDHIPEPVISVSPESGTLYVGMEITLDASNSRDRDGDSLSYSWSQPEGQSVALNPIDSSTNAVVNFSVTTAGTYTFTLTATDGKYEASTRVSLEIIVDEANEPPVFTSSSDPISVTENTTEVIHTAAASDPEDDTLTFSIAGSDAEAFSIDSSSGALSFASAPNFEAPTDEDTDNTYQLSLQVFDGNSLISQELSISVTDINEAPTITSASSAGVAENSSGTIHTAAATDPEDDTLTYSLGGTDASHFSIDSSSGALSFNSSPDFEAPTDADSDNTYELTIAVTDSITDSVTQAITIVVTDVNDNTPVITAGQSFGNVSEGSTDGTELGAVVATDADVGTTLQSWTITAGNTDNDFALDPASGVLSVASDASLDFETKPSYTLQLTVQDDDGTNTSEATEVTITIADINEAPTFASASAATTAPENSTAAFYTAAATDQDADSSITYSLPSATADNSLFAIAADSGALSFSNSKNYEAGVSSYTVVIRASDGSLSSDLGLSVTLTDVNEAPSFTSATDPISFPENSTAIVYSATASDVDADDTQAYSIAGGADQNLFTLTGADLSFKAAPDYESGQSTYQVILRVTDSGNLHQDLELAIEVTNVNEAPSFTSATTELSVAENAADVIYTAAASDVDADDTQAYSIAGGTDKDLFIMNGADLSFIDAPDYENESGTTTYAVTIRVTDSAGLYEDLALSISVTDINEAPTFASASDSATAPENSTAAFYTAAASDDDGDSIVYSLASGVADNDLFSITTDGALSLQQAQDYEAGGGTYEVKISASDGQLSAATNLTLTVTLEDVNEAPTFASTSDSATVSENSTDAFYTAAATDPDAGASIAYSLASGVADNDLFSITADGALSLQQALDYETDSTTYTVQITASDGSLSAADLELTVTLDDVDEQPTFTSALSVEVDENTDDIVYTATASDPEGKTLSYQIVAGNDIGAFQQITSAGNQGTISFKENNIPNFESPADANGDNTYELTISVSDGTTASVTQAITIVVADVNDNTPVITAGQSFANVSEDSAAGTELGAVSATDADAGTTFQSWNITGGNTDGDFTIASATGMLSVASGASLDFESKPNYTLQLTVQDDDGTNTSAAAEVSISVADVNDNAPVITAGQSFAGVSEDSADGTELGAVAATDADAGTTFQSWNITGGNTDNDFAIDPASGVLSVASGASLDFETKPSYTLQLTVQDDDGTNTSAAAEVTISIADVNEAPTITSADAISVDENEAGVIYTIAIEDEDASDSHTYALAGGTDQALFSLSGAELSFIAAPDYETLPTSGDNVYEVQLRVTDSGSPSLSADLSLSITVENVNEAPTITNTNTAVSTAEDTVNNPSAFEYAITATDPEGEALSYALGGADATDFDVDSDGVITFKSGRSGTGYDPNFEHPVDDGGDNVYQLDLYAQDASGNTSSYVAITISVTDELEAPTFASASDESLVSENTSAVFYLAEASDDDGDSVSYSLASGEDNGLFTISSTLIESVTYGELSFSSAPDYEIPTDFDNDGIYNVTITASDGSLSSTLALAVTVQDVNDAPVFSSTSDSTSAPEDSTATFYTATATDQDADASLTYSLAGGADDAFFNLDPASGELRFLEAQDREAAANDANTDYTYEVQITASDGTYSTETALSLSVTLENVNEAPTVTNTVTAISVVEDTNSSPVSFQYTITASDPENDSLVYSISGTDAAAFDVDPGTGLITFKDGVSGTPYDPNYEYPSDANDDNLYQLDILASDSALDSSSVAIQVSVTDVSAAPNFVNSSGASLGSGDNFADSASFAENGTGAAYTAITVDDDDTDDFVKYHITGGVDSDLFEITNDQTGEIFFKSSPDYELAQDDGGDNTYIVEVNATDSNDTTVITLSITIDNLNDNAPDIATQSLDIIEDAANGSTVGAVTVSDADEGSGLATTYQNWQITGGNTNSAFAIDASGAITVADTTQIDYESGTTIYSLSVSVSDGDNTGTGTVTVNINDTNDEAPVINSASPNLAENASANDLVATLTADDPEDNTLGTTLQSWTITSGNTDSIFALDPTSGELTVADTTNLDYDVGAQSYSLLVTVSDGTNTSAEQTITVTITDVNDEDPVITTGQSFSTNEISPNDTEVGTVAYTDPDTDNTFTWSIESGNTNSAFAIGETTGIITVNDTSQLSYPSTYSLEIKLEDGGATTTAATATVSIAIEENILPTDLAASSEPTKVTLTWSSTSSSGTITYEIYRSSDSGCDLANPSLCPDDALITSATSPQEDTGVTLGTTYYYWIKADRSSDGLSQTSATPISATPKAGLNDTGVDWAGDSDTANNSDCTSTIAASQDCHVGRDATNHDDTDGNAGFSFTKLDSNGNELLASESGHSCVRDNITGLTWEVKDDDYTLHYNRDQDFAHYDTNTSTNGGDNGTDSASFNTCYGYNSSDPATFCNTEAFVDRVNSAGLCGYNDWRMPTYSELLSIADFGELVNGRGIDTSFFPYYNDTFWSSTVRATSSGTGTSAYGVNFTSLGLGGYGRSSRYSVRLVRK